MKTLNHALIAMALIALSISSASAQTALEKLHSYVDSGDRQDVSALNKVLSSKFTSTYTFGGNGKLKTLGRDGLLNGFKSKKFGGKARTVEISAITESGSMSIIQAKLKSAELVFEGTFIFVKNDEDWKLSKEFLVVRSVN